jgi:hypothetical protein
VRDVTHIVFGAYTKKATAAKSTVNVAIPRNLLDIVEETSPGRYSSAIGTGSMAASSRADCGPWASGAGLPHHTRPGRTAVPNG